MFKRSLGGIATAAAAAAIVISGAAFAGPIIDKGDLGKYERTGRYVHRVLSKETQPARSSVVQSAGNEAVRYDKGDLGTYERQGRFVRRVKTVAPRDTGSAHQHQAPKYRVVRHLKHIHRYPI